MPNWFWPQARQVDSTAAIRAGRVLHWGFSGLGLIVLGVSYPLGILLFVTNDPGWSLAPGLGSLFGFPLFFAGRALRYILSNE